MREDVDPLTAAAESVRLTAEDTMAGPELDGALWAVRTLLKRTEALRGALSEALEALDRG